MALRAGNCMYSATSGMPSIVGERERTHLESMHVHTQLLMPVSNTPYSVNRVLISVYSYTHAFTPSYYMYETAKFVRPIERGRI